MANGSKGGDMVLGSRHLAGIFVVLVLLFGVVFTLGYVLGRNHGEAQLRAAADSATVADASPAADARVGASKDGDKDKDKSSSTTAKPGENLAPPPTDWNFYHSAEPADPSERLAPKAKPVSVEKTPVATVPPASLSARQAGKQPKSQAPNSRGLNAPLIPRDSTVLQVAALVRQGDALALAQALQQKKFPAFVLSPSGDHYYRVQIGPYANLQAANLARKRLESQGFKSIVKR